MHKMFLILFSIRLKLRTNVLFFLKKTVIEVLDPTLVVLANCTFSHCALPFYKVVLNHMQ